MIWIFIFLTALIILITTFIQNSNAKNKYNSALNLATENVRRCEDRMNEIAKPVFELIIKQYGERFASNVAEKKICEQMPEELLILSWGNPDYVKTNFYKGTKTESWFYDSYINRLGNTKYRTEVIVENNKIVGWKDLV